MGIKVLLVEDDRSLREALTDTLLLTVPNLLGVEYNAHVIESILKSAGLEVVCFPDGESLEEKMIEERPDLLLLDIAMPGLDGIGVARALAEPLARDLGLTAPGWPRPGAWQWCFRQHQPTRR